jgi:hypothetical protein
MEPQAFQTPPPFQALQPVPPVSPDPYKPKRSFNIFLILFIITGILMIAAAVFAVIYYGKYAQQRDANQPIIEAAVKEAETAQKSKLEAEFVEREKLPTKTYTSPSEFGTIKLAMPKTWSQYVDTKSSGQIQFYAHPSFVPADGVNYALRMSVMDQDYAAEIKKYESAIKKGDLSSSSAQIAGVTGIRIDGQLKKDQTGSMVVFPLRDKTLRVWTENVEFKGDFDNIVLKALTFVP